MEEVETVISFKHEDVLGGFFEEKGEMFWTFPSECVGGGREGSEHFSHTLTGWMTSVIHPVTSLQYQQTFLSVIPTLYFSS